MEFCDFIHLFPVMEYVIIEEIYTYESPDIIRYPIQAAAEKLLAEPAVGHSTGIGGHGNGTSHEYCLQ